MKWTSAETSAAEGGDPGGAVEVGLWLFGGSGSQGGCDFSLRRERWLDVTALKKETREQANCAPNRSLAYAGRFKDNYFGHQVGLCYKTES